jgi:Mn2+/Fe2+ NRAMP family transporter
MSDEKTIEPESAVRDPVERSWIKRLGPGLITGAADDDPSGIGTYSQAGAQFGFALLWVILLTYPLMTAIQLVSARIGRVTGKGLASNMRAHYPAWLLYGAVALLVMANVINIAADLSAMGAAVGLLVHGPQHVYVVVLGSFSVVLQIFVPYDRYARFLKWSALSLLAYVAVAFIVPVPWGEVAHAIVLPRISLTSDYLTTVVAVLGTTISPYLFFWQASQEVEEMRSSPSQGPLRRLPRQAPAQLRRISFDTWVGMGVSNAVAFFIVLTAATTLHLHHIEVKTSADAARALAPIAGRFAYVLFALGIVGTGLLALPVLAGSGRNA